MNTLYYGDNLDVLRRYIAEQPGLQRPVRRARRLAGGLADQGSEEYVALGRGGRVVQDSGKSEAGVVAQ